MSATCKCGSTIYRCRRCGSSGCTRTGCSNNQFKNGVCTKCRRMDKEVVK